MTWKIGRVALAAAVLGGTAVAQRTWTFESPAHGLTMKLPRWLEPVPSKPGDEQTIGQFKGQWAASDRTWGKEPELTILVVRIVRTDGPTTGAEPKEEEEPFDPQSLTELRVERLNSAKNLGEYCKLRGYADGLLPENDLLKKPVEDEDETAYQLFKYPSPRGAKFGAHLYAFTDEDTNESFGVIALGPGCNAHFREVVRIVQSITRVPVAADADPAADVYAGSELRDLERRRKVRRELVPGWDAYDSENYILVTNVKSKKMIEVMLTDLEVIRAAFLARFPPAEGADMSAVSTVRFCDGYEDYLSYAGKHMDGTGGYWMFTEEELVLFNPERKVPRSRPWLAKVEPHRVMYHEAMHQYFHYSNRALAPASWFNEGYGEYFGGAEIDRRKKDLRDIDPNMFRLDLIRLANKQDRPVPNLRSMLAMTQSEFYGRNALANYAYSWAFCHFLEGQRELSDRNRQRVAAWCELPDRYLTELRAATAAKRAEMPAEVPEDWIAGFQDQIQKVAIEKALDGIDMTELQAAFEAYVRKM